MRGTLAVGGSIVALMAYEAPAVAQTAATPTVQPESNTAPDTGTRDIIVTGSRVHSGFTAPSPTLVVGAADIQQRGAVNVFQVLSELPSVSSRTSASATAIRFQAAGQNFADLRTLGPQRTLTLVDGRRFIPTVPTVVGAGNVYQVDMNLIPSLMVDRVDVVTGGASAAYGSDAISGVINFIMKRKVQGIQGEVQTGISQRGDAQQYRLGLVGGFDFGEGRGRVVISGDYVKDKGIPDYRARAYAVRFWNLFNDPTSTLANGKPKQIVVTDADTQPGNRTAGGLIVSATGGTAAQRTALVGLQFDSATTVSQFVRGRFNPATTTVTATTTSQTFAGNQAGGNNPDLNINTLIPPIERRVFYGRSEYELSDRLTVSAYGSYGWSKALFQGSSTSDQASIYNAATASGSQVRIYADNPYIPAVIRSSIPSVAGSATPPAQSFVLARANYDIPGNLQRVVDTAYTGGAALEGDLGGGWGWDASYGWGRSRYQRTTYGARDRTKYAMAADAIVNPANGQIICRSTLTDPGNGCVPINLFGSRSPSAAAIDYVTDDLTGRLDYTQQTAQANLHGSPFSTWAGEVAIAAGAEWRHEKLNAVVLPASGASPSYDSSIGLPFAGKFTVKEAYGEATVPLAKDLPFAQSLAVNGAIRHAEYSQDAKAAGGQTTWKVGATYTPVTGLLLRFTHSLDIRAPSLYELRAPSVNSVQQISFGGQTFTSVRINQPGNIALTPEKSKTLTFGGTLAPRFLPGLQLSVDYYHIRVRNVIANFSAPSIALACDRGLTAFCSLMSFSGAGTSGTLLSITDQFLNLATYDTKGIDLNAAYRFPLGNGQLTARGSATYLHNFTITSPGSPPSVQEFAGGLQNSTFNTPKWRANGSLTYAQNPFSLTLQTLFVAAGKLNPALLEVATATSQPDISPADNHVDHYFQFNLSGTFDVLPDGKAQAFMVINNLLDRQPNFAPNVNSRVQVNGAFNDLVGRYFRFGVRFKI